MLFASVGIRGGTIFVASDNQAAFIKEDPVPIRHISATIYHLLGIDPATPVCYHASTRRRGSPGSVSACSRD